jgi:signal transduction histidine kinase
MTRLIELWRASRAHYLLLDGFLAGSIFVMTILAHRFGHGDDAGPLTPQIVVIGAISCAALIFRRRWPRQVMAITVAGMMVFLATGGMRSPITLAPMLGVYTLALVSSRRATVWLGVTSAFAVGAAAVLLGDQSWIGPIVVANAAELGLGAAIGDSVRSRRAYIAAIEERAHRAERTREEEATRRVMEERLRIARELHDVLAHHIALINVQAGVAALVLDDKPDQARESLAHIRQAGRDALDELRTTVGLLRQPDSPDELPTEPAPGLDRLPDLIASFTASGLSVDPWIEGETQDLPATIDLTAYRIVQEALTNVSKHAGDATASVRLTFAPSDLRIEVTDTGTGQNLAAPGTGHGLLGMRERALSVGGTFSAGPGRHGGFQVLARLPVPRQVRKWCRP